MGHYVRSSLMKDERVVFETSLHWSIFFRLSAILTLFIWPILRMMSSEFAVTDKRVVIKEGLFSRRTVEMNVQKVENVKVNQSILGRMFDCGVIEVVGTGGTHEVFDGIRGPAKFRRAVQECQGGA